ncbi:MAG: site-specific integrase [Acetobacteraceae bacterium]|nr:site-specific integrase [Acetobacteraceae bacterium]
MPKLTKRVVDGAEIRATEYFIWCDELPGFGLRVFPSGKRSYLVQYRAGGRSRRVTIWLHGRLTADEARKEAMALLGQVAKGGDPAEERATRRKSMTVQELCERYLQAAEQGLVMGKKGRPKKPLTLYSDKGRIERHIIPLLGRRLVRDLTSVDVTRLIRDIATGKTATVEKTKLRGKAVVTGGRGVATRTAGLLGGILSFAVSEGIIATNPAHGVKKPAYQKRKERLTPEQYRRLGQALQAASNEGATPSAINAIWLLALTGCRKSEILHLRWSEVDERGHAFRLEDSKEGASVRPIGSPVFEMLAEMGRREGAVYVLPGARSGGPYGALPKAWQQIAKRAELEGVTLHTLRHSFASVAGDLGYSDPTIGALLGHASGTVTGRYTHILDAVLIAAADRVAKTIHSYMTGQIAEVVELRRA